MPLFHKKAKSGIVGDNLRNLVKQWLLKIPDYREERRFLEAHPALLDPKAATVLEQIIADAYASIREIESRTGKPSSEERAAMQVLRDHLTLLRDIARRGATLAAIREGYVNAFGGLILELPPWLEKVERQLEALCRPGRRDQTAVERMTLLRAALVRAQHEPGLASEVLAELSSQLWDAIDDAVGVDSRQRQQEEGIACLLAALRIYTSARYPRQYARTQTKLGNAYRGRIAGEQRVNLEQAIACYPEALRVCTYEVFPMEYATTQNNLGLAYQQRVEGERRVNLEQAIACYREALRVCTYEAFPEEYATTQTKLGTAYAERIAGERRVNLEQAIACYQEALRVYTYEAFPMEYATTQNNLGGAYQERIEGKRRVNLEQAIACFQEALRVRTLEAFPGEYRETQLNCALAEAARYNWAGTHEAYRSALVAEDLLVALGAGTIGRDVVLQQGRDAAIHDGFALTRLARLPEAAVAIEGGRARGLAEALALDAADPALIHSDELRTRYRTARAQFIAAQKDLNAPLPRNRTESEQRRLNLQYTETYQQAKAAFDAIVAEVRAAHDPADFLEPVLDPPTILRAAEQGGAGHALVYLAATPWGGVAVAALSAKADLPTPARFATLDLPRLTTDLLGNLILVQLSDSTQRIGCGFALAQAGLAFSLMEGWSGATFQAQAAALHAACVAANQASTLDAAAQAILTHAAWAHLVDQPLTILSEADRRALAEALNHLVLSLEVSRCLTALAEAALRPLVVWLQEQGVTSLTLIPCGSLAAFPLAAVPLADGRTVGETLPTSVAPSARSLLHDEHTTAERAGLYTLGDPRPTRQELQWGEAEALSLAKLASQLGLAAESRVREAATRAWLIEALQKGHIVDASCHGGFDLSEPLQSALSLAAAERLTLGDMLSHVADLRGLRLLILSACQTAILDLQGAQDEVHSLAAGMVQAGAQAVLAALWAVDDKATYLLMVRFAQEWLPHQESEPPAAALAWAQRWLRTVTNRELQTWHAGDFSRSTGGGALSRVGFLGRWPEMSLGKPQDATHSLMLFQLLGRRSHAKNLPVRGGGASCGRFPDAGARFLGGGGTRACRGKQRGTEDGGWASL